MGAVVVALLLRVVVAAGLVVLELEPRFLLQQTPSTPLLLAAVGRAKQEQTALALPVAIPYSAPSLPLAVVVAHLKRPLRHLVPTVLREVLAAAGVEAAQAVPETLQTLHRRRAAMAGVVVPAILI